MIWDILLMIFSHKAEWERSTRGCASKRGGHAAPIVPEDKKK